MSLLVTKRFRGLLRREFLEHPNLFVAVPFGVALLLALSAGLALRNVEGNNYRFVLNYLIDAVNAASERDFMAAASVLAQPLQWLNLVFMMIFGLCSIFYLGGTLYQDRRDLSVLFWQSMPVSNLSMVMSKIVTIILIAPLSYLLIMLLLYAGGLGSLAYLELNQSFELLGLGRLSLVVLYSLGLSYLTVVLSVLWLFPAVGWILLFSAFARRTPLLWALGVFLLIGMLEDLVFGSQYLANWGESRIRPWEFGDLVVTSPADFLNNLLTYEMFIGVALGSILVTGAVFMRRFID